MNGTEFWTIFGENRPFNKVRGSERKFCIKFLLNFHEISRQISMAFLVL